MHEPGQAAKRTIGRRVALRANRGIAVGSGNDHLPSLVDRNGCSRLAVRVASTKGGWTRKLAHWLARKHREMSFHLTQVMNDHGNLVICLERFKITDLDGCLKCGSTGTRRTAARPAIR